MVSDWDWGLHGGRSSLGLTEMPGTKITRRCLFVLLLGCLQDLESMKCRKEKYRKEKGLGPDT